MMSPTSSSFFEKKTLEQPCIAPDLTGKVVQGGGVVPSLTLSTNLNLPWVCGCILTGGRPFSAAILSNPHTNSGMGEVGLEKPWILSILQLPAAF